MQTRAFGFAALLAVIGISIVFGMVLGGRLNAPPVALAAPDRASLQLTPKTSGVSPVGSFADIVEEALPAVVSVTSTRTGEDEDGSDNFHDEPFFRRFFGEPDERDRRQPMPRVGAGSGFIISADGYVMTNNHVIDGSDKVEIAMHDGTRYDAEVIGTDPSIDLALLKVEPEGDLPTLPLGDSADLRVGEWVIAIGNPLEFEQTVTVGVVSGKKRRVPLPSTDIGVVNFIQTDAAINLGNSGGPLIDAQGNVVGINTAISRRDFAEGIGFALPIDMARDVVEQLRISGEVRRGFIGIMMNDTGVDEATRDYYDLPSTDGVVVNSVNEGGPADLADVKSGDIILEVDGDKVRDNPDLISKISSRQPGEKVRLRVFRDGRTLTRDVELGDRAEGMRASGPAPSEMPRRDEPMEATGLGVTVENITSRVLERLEFDSSDPTGVIIVDVEFDSEAARKGITPDMVVVGVNDQTVGDVADWEEAIEGLAPGAPVKLDVIAPIPGDDRTMFFFLRAPRD